MKKNLRNVLLYIAIPIILIISIMSVSRLTKNTAETKYYQIVDMIGNNEISEFQLNIYSGELVYTLREDGKKYRYTVADSSIFYNDVNEIVMEIAISIIFVIISLALILAVLFQSGKSSGLSGLVGGSSDSFLAKNKARSLDARLAKATKWIAIAFMVLALVLGILH